MGLPEFLGESLELHQIYRLYTLFLLGELRMMFSCNAPKRRLMVWYLKLKPLEARFWQIFKTLKHICPFHWNSD